MARDLNEAEKTALELLIDSCSLASILMALSEIADEKAEHIEDSYANGGKKIGGYSDAQAHAWATACGELGVLVTKKSISRVSG